MFRALPSELGQFSVSWTQVDAAREQLRALGVSVVPLVSPADRGLLVFDVAACPGVFPHAPGLARGALQDLLVDRLYFSWSRPGGCGTTSCLAARWSPAKVAALKSLGVLLEVSFSGLECAPPGKPGPLAC